MRYATPGQRRRKASASPAVGKRTTVRIRLPADDGFQLFDRHGDRTVAEDAAAGVGHQQVVFDADAAEIEIAAAQQVVDDDPAELAFGFALVDERRDEVDARLRRSGSSPGADATWRGGGR